MDPSSTPGSKMLNLGNQWKTGLFRVIWLQMIGLENPICLKIILRKECFKFQQTLRLTNRSMNAEYFLIRTWSILALIFLSFLWNIFRLVSNKLFKEMSILGSIVSGNTFAAKRSILIYLGELGYWNALVHGIHPTVIHGSKMLYGHCDRLALVNDIDCLLNYVRIVGTVSRPDR